MAKKKVIKKASKNVMSKQIPKGHQIDPVGILRELENNPDYIPEYPFESKEEKSSGAFTPETPLPIPTSIDSDLKELILAETEGGISGGVLLNSVLLIQMIRNHDDLSRRINSLEELMSVVATHMIPLNEQETPKAEQPQEQQAANRRVVFSNG